MNTLKYDITRIAITKINKPYYFIRDNKYNVFVSDGMDLSSAVYFLMIILRDYGNDHEQYVQLLQKGDFDFQNKSYYDEGALLDLVESCKEDAKKLYLNREHDINLKALNKSNELESMAYISNFNPKRNFYSNYLSKESEEMSFIEVLIREMTFEKMLQKMMELLKNNMEEEKSSKLTLQELFDTDDLASMIKGPNGDLWFDLFIQVNMPEREKFQLLYRAQPFRILDFKKHSMDLDYLRYAIDGVKKNQEDLKKLFVSLPRSMQNNNELINFYSWHLQR